jgi:hypothetical protein
MELNQLNEISEKTGKKDVKYSYQLIRTQNVNNHPVNEVYHLIEQNRTTKMPEKAKDLVQKVVKDQE